MRAYHKRSDLGWRDMEGFPEEVTLELRNETGVTSPDVQVVSIILAHYREVSEEVEDTHNFKLFNQLRWELMASWHRVLVKMEGVDRLGEYLQKQVNRVFLCVRYRASSDWKWIFKWVLVLHFAHLDNCGALTEVRSAGIGPWILVLDIEFLRYLCKIQSGDTAELFG